MLSEECCDSLTSATSSGKEPRGRLSRGRRRGEQPQGRGGKGEGRRGEGEGGRQWQAGEWAGRGVGRQVGPSKAQAKNVGCHMSISYPTQGVTQLCHLPPLPPP